MGLGIRKLLNGALRRSGFELRRIPRPVPPPSDTLRRGLRLYVGCGDDTRTGFTGCDVRPLRSVAVVCRAWEVSQHCAEIAEIYSRHMLEHLSLSEVQSTLRDWKRALAPDGRLHIIVPNMDFHVEQWRRATWDEASWGEKFSDARYSMAGFWGWQSEADAEAPRADGADAYWDTHKCGFNRPALRFMLERESYEVLRCEVEDDAHLVAEARKSRE